MIVNERFASEILPRPERDPGKRIQPGFSADNNSGENREIVGVVGNVKHLSLKNEDSPEMYLPRTQIPFDIMSLVLRTRVSDPTSVTNAVRAELATLDSTIPLTGVRVFDMEIRLALAGAAALQRATALDFRRWPGSDRSRDSME